MISNKLIISLYDFTGQWAKPYADAGYAILLWDKKVEGDILEHFSWLCIQIDEWIEESPENEVFGILAAPPCTDFAGSGARWWPEKDKGDNRFFPFDSSTELSEALVLIILHLVELYRPHFWALENPVGRIEKRVPEIKPFRRMIFNPCDFGDPYTKKTILWGDFNANLPFKKVQPILGSLIHRMAPGPDRQEKRSATPAGFAKAFFEANNLYSKPVSQFQLFAA